MCVPGVSFCCCCCAGESNGDAADVRGRTTCWMEVPVLMRVSCTQVEVWHAQKGNGSHFSEGKCRDAGGSKQGSNTHLRAASHAAGHRLS